MKLAIYALMPVCVSARAFVTSSSAAAVGQGETPAGREREVKAGVYSARRVVAPAAAEVRACLQAESACLRRVTHARLEDTALVPAGISTRLLVCAFLSSPRRRLLLLITSTTASPLSPRAASSRPASSTRPTLLKPRRRTRLSQAHTLCLPDCCSLPAHAHIFPPSRTAVLPTA
jgi:hypothetical protein